MPEGDGVLVEFVGLPASGKSRLARETQEYLGEQREHGVPIRSCNVTTSSEKRSEQSGLGVGRAIGAELVRAPISAARTGRALLASNQLSRMKTLRLFGYHHYLRAELRQAKRANEIHLADQGFLQHLRRVHLTARSEGLAYLHPLVETCYPPIDPDLVVFVDVDHQTRMERAVARGTDIDEALFDPTHPAIQDDLDSYADIKQFVRTIAAETDLSYRILTVENRADNLTENVETIATAIETTLDSS